MSCMTFVEDPPIKFGFPPSELKAREGGPPNELRGLRHMSVMALPTHRGLTRQYHGGLLIINIPMDTGQKLSSQDDFTARSAGQGRV